MNIPRNVHYAARPGQAVHNGIWDMLANDRPEAGNDLDLEDRGEARADGAADDVDERRVDSQPKDATAREYLAYPPYFFGHIRGRMALSPFTQLVNSHPFREQK